MDRPRVSRSEAAFMIGVPLAWAVLLLFHPSGEADRIYLSLRDQVTAWLVVHIGMMLFIPLMAAGIYVLLRGVEGAAARVSRIALVPFVVFFTAYETLQGTANGILVNELNGLPEQERAAPSRSSASPPPWCSSGEAGRRPWRRLARATARFRMRGPLPRRPTA